jgi:hypothetical protein
MSLSIFQHLLPRAKAWRITVDKQLRQFFDGLVVPLVDDTKEFIDLVWSDIDPQQTRELTAWESQWGLLSTDLTTQERRDRLAATWKALGGQSPKYIQDTLRNAGFNVYVHEWWEEPVVGGNPIARNPLLYINDGLSQFLYSAICGGAEAVCGSSETVCGASLEGTGYPLVNKVFAARQLIVCGAQEANCGNAGAICGSREATYSEKVYAIPRDLTKWPYFLYIGAQSFPDHASVPLERRNEFETLLLKICPTHLWIGVLVDYT